MNARSIGVVTFWLLLALQPIWHIWLSPASVLPPWLLVSLLTLPLLPPTIGLLLRKPSALFWGGVIGLLHFCHGISELWTDSTVTALALTEVLLTTALICAIGWDGLKKRRAAKAVMQPALVSSEVDQRRGT